MPSFADTRQLSAASTVKALGANPVTHPKLHMRSVQQHRLVIVNLERTSYLVYQVVIVILLQVAVCWVAKNDVVQEPLQVALQPVLSTMHQLLSQPASSS